jgi:hypothetical protein
MKLRRRPAIGEQRDVLIDEGLRKCVAFLCVNRTDEQTGAAEKTPAASVFFIDFPLGDTGYVRYAVTARHVLDMSRPYGPLYIRVNTLDGFEDVEVPQDSWVSHPTTDVAVARVSLSSNEYDFNGLSTNMLVTDEYAEEESIGEGDDVFFAGLFAPYWGAERAEPIIRFGNISLGTRGKVPVKLNPDEERVPVDAYLVEARSWGGHSGAPAFVSFTPHRELMVRGYTRDSGPPAKLLGLVNGHYDMDTDVKFMGDMPGSGKVPLNTGIAIVIPAQKILDLLATPELVEERESMRKEQARRVPTPTLDADLPAEGYQRSDFMRDLKKVAKKQNRPSPPDSKTR